MSKQIFRWCKCNYEVFGRRCSKYGKGSDISGILNLKPRKHIALNQIQKSMLFFLNHHVTHVTKKNNNNNFADAFI